MDMLTLDLMAPGDNRPPVTVERIILAIKQAIITAEEAKVKEEREACANVAKAIKEKELRRLGIETCCSLTAAEIEECIRARSEGEKKGE